MPAPTYEELVGEKAAVPSYEELTGGGDVPSYEELTGSTSTGVAYPEMDVTQIAPNPNQAIAPPETREQIQERFQTQGGTLKEFSEAKAVAGIPEEDAFNQPIISGLPRPTGDNVGAGIVRGLENVAESLTTPTNIALMSTIAGAPAVIQRIASAGFAAQAAKAVPEQIVAATEAKTLGEAAERFTEAGASALIAATAGIHAGTRMRLAEPSALPVEATKTQDLGPVTPKASETLPAASATQETAPGVAEAKPITLYHGTRNVKGLEGRLSTASKENPVHLGTEEQAAAFHKGGKVFEVEADIKNPAVAGRDANWSNDALDALDALSSPISPFPSTEPLYWELRKRIESAPFDKKMTTLLDELERQGFDSIKYPNEVEGKGDSFIVWDAAKVKEKPPSTTGEAVGGVGPKAGPAPFTPEALQSPPSRRAGITAQPSFKEPTALKRALTTAVGWLRPRGHHPEEQYARLQVRDSEIAAGDRVIAYASRDLMSALKEQYGLSKVEMLGGGTKRIPVNDVQWMTRYLKGDPVAQNFVPAKIRGPLDTMRAAIDSKSQQVIDRLVADQRTLASGSAPWQRIQDTIDTVRGNMDVYVHRAYKFFDSKEPAPDWYDRLPTGVRQDAEAYIAGSTPVPLTPPEARSRILDWLSDLKEQQIGSGKLGSKDPSIMMRRHLSTPELRAVLGEYGSPMELYAKSMGKMTKWVANHRFLNDVRDMGMGRWLFEEGTNPPGFNARIAAEGSESMSPLSGLRTTHEIAEAFNNLYANPAPSWPIVRWYYAAVAQSKFAATAQSVMTQDRNLLGRPMMALMAGHWNPKHVGTAVKAVWSDLAGNNKRWQAFVKEAYDYGVLGDTAHGAEMQAILKDAALQDVDPAALYSWSLTRAAKQVGWKIPGDVYRASDDMGNLVGWLNEIESQKAIHPHLTDAQIKQKAASIVRDIYPTYSETPAVVQVFRKVPLTGAFVTFPYQTVRTAYNSMMRGLLEVRSTNAAERAVGAKRLAGIATVLSSPFILQEVSKLATGVNTQQEDDYRSYQPDWSRNSRFAFLDQDSASGELTAINLSYLDPYSYMTDPIMSAISSMRIDEPVDAAIARATHEFFRPWIDEQMVTRAIVDSARNTTTTGREIFNETDTSYQKAAAISRHIGEALTPGTARRAAKRIVPAFKGEQTAYGGKLEPVTEIAREVTGIALEKFNFKNGLAAKVKPFRDKVDSSEDVFRRAATQVATTSPAQIVDAYRTSEERRLSQYRQMRGFYLAAVRQGVDPEEAEEILESRGMTKRDIRNIAAGQYEPLKITPAIRKRAADIGRELPEDQIQAIQDEAASILLD